MDSGHQPDTLTRGSSPEPEILQEQPLDTNMENSVEEPSQHANEGEPVDEQSDAMSAEIISENNDIPGEKNENFEPLPEIVEPADVGADLEVSNPPSSTGRQFTTPLKSLPPLKDIEHITTPKSFGVARDADFTGPVRSSPMAQHANSIQLQDLAEAEEDAFDATANDTFASNSVLPKQHDVQDDVSADLTAAATFLDVDPSALLASASHFVAKLAQRAQKLHGLQSELSFFKLNLEQVNQLQLKKFEQFQEKLDKLSQANAALALENEKLNGNLQLKDSHIAELRQKSAVIADKLYKLENSHQESDSSHAMALGSKDQEIYRLNEQITQLTRSSIDQGQKLSDLVKELNEVTNEKFVAKLDLSKATNELSYIKTQKEWYENQLKAVQSKYTDLIKRHDSDYLRDSSKISSLTSQNENLVALKESLSEQVKELETTKELLVSKITSLESKSEVQSIKYSKELSLKDEQIELLNIQLNERSDRVTQLEEYASDIKSSSAASVSSLMKELSEKDDKIAELVEKLRRTEDALDSELHKETELPKLAPSAEMILQNGASGISLSKLYTEFNHIKKELVLERSQKDKLAVQLQMFVAELESKKPAIANYRNQIQHYEESLKEMLDKLESVRLDKVESEKECNRLRTRLGSYELELETVKQLTKDLGRQLCYYLIHSKIRDGNEDPLSLSERKAIDQILIKSGNKDNKLESDTDQLITERLVGFADIVELQKKNEELLVAVRLLGKQLEEKDHEPNGLEAAAVEEARDAILTLQSELESMSVKYDACVKERDLLKSLQDTLGSAEGSAEAKSLRSANSELRAKLAESETSINTFRAQSEQRVKDINEKLSQLANDNESLKMNLAASKHSSELSESRLESTGKFLENVKKELEYARKETTFWKDQASKQEELLVAKSNELRDSEKKLFELSTVSNNLLTEKEVSAMLQKSLKEEVQQLKKDKDQLNSFVFNLQTLLKEREDSSNDLSRKLSQSVENYQSLQEKLNEKEEKIMILSSQSDLALKSQNAKLEQVNELSQKLLEARSKLSEKTALIERLQSARQSSQPHSNNSAAEVSRTPASNGDPQIHPSEYEDLKLALKLAEMQVTEFSAIAKGAEEALVTANQSYDQYKSTTDEKLRELEEEKQELIEELEAAKTSLSSIQDQAREAEKSFTAQLQELRTQAQENARKANSFDELKNDYDNKISVLNHDLSNQASVAEDLQKRYDAKLSETELLNRQLAKLKDDKNDLELKIADVSLEMEKYKLELVSRDETIAEQKASEQDELSKLQIKIKDLQYQYDLAMNQIELSQSVAGPEGGDENLRQVVSFLRAEKDAAEAKARSVSENVELLTSQVESLTAELNASKSQILRLQNVKFELDETNKDHQRLTEQLEQLNILRESNMTLRNENKMNLDRIVELETELKDLQKLAKQADTSPSDQVELRQQEIRLLTEENERLKNQLNNNEEHKNLMQRFENLKAEFKSKLLGHRSKNRELEKQLNDLKENYDKVQAEMSELKAQDTQSVSLLKSQLLEVNAAKADAERQYAEELKAAQEKFDLELKAAKESLEQQSKSNASTENFEQKLEAAVQARMKAEAENLQSLSKSEAEEIKRSVTREYEDKIKTINDDFAKKLEEEKAKALAAAEKKHEFRVKILNRKVEKLERDQKQGITPDPVPDREPKNSSSAGDQGSNPEHGEGDEQKGKKRQQPQSGPLPVNFKRSKD